MEAAAAGGRTRGARERRAQGWPERGQLGADRGVLTPYAGLTLGDGESRTVRTGARCQLGADAVIGLEAAQHTSDGNDAASELRLREALRL